MWVTRLLLGLRRGWFRQAALWVMVPLAFFNGWPVVGCICGDGSYKSNCPALRQSASEITSESCCCTKACGSTAEPDIAVQSCCRTAADSKESQSQDTTHLAVKHKGCHIVVESGVLPLLLQPVQIVDAHQVPALFGITAWEAVKLLHAPSLATFVENDTGQHPSDLVIRLCRLVI